MSFRMDRGPRRATKYPFVVIKPQKTAFVVFTVDADQIEGTPMHWLAESRLSVPCGREHCVFCPQLPKRYAYFAPVMEWWTPSGYSIGKKPFQYGSWRKAVLRITEHIETLLSVNQAGKVIEIYRSGEYANAPLNFRILEEIPESLRVDLSPHDIMPTLLAAWGMYADLVDEEARVGSQEPGAL